MAKHYGATVYVCDYKPEARALALSLGAEQAFDHAGLTAAIADTAENPFTVDVAIDFVVDAQCMSMYRLRIVGLVPLLTLFDPSTASLPAYHWRRQENG